LEERARAGVLGMPGRCSQEKGTAVEALSGEGRKRWKGDGEGAKKENGEDGEEAKEALALDGRRRRRRRGVAPAAGVAGAGGVEEVGMDGLMS
jgi:hypothetical protein